MLKINLQQDIVILAIQSLPDKSLSATFKNLSLFFLIYDVKFPCSSTSEYLFNNASRGTLRLLNLILALSTPFNPNLCPKSSIKTPFLILLSSFLILIRKV